MASGTINNLKGYLQKYFDTTVSGKTWQNSLVVRKWNQIVMVNFAIGDGTAFSSYTPGTICTLDSTYRPNATSYGFISARDGGTWGTANYTYAMIQVNADGTVLLLGNQTSIRSMKYLNGNAWYMTSD